MNIKIFMNSIAKIHMEITQNEFKFSTYHNRFKTLDDFYLSKS